MNGHGWVTPLPDGAVARCGGPPMCSVCMAEWDEKNALLTNVCMCGKALRFLNPISPRPTCVGCGFLDDACRCVLVGVH